MHGFVQARVTSALLPAKRRRAVVPRPWIVPADCHHLPASLRNAEPNRTNRSTLFLAARDSLKLALAVAGLGLDFPALFRLSYT
jgi:hypothetical protein